MKNINYILRKYWWFLNFILVVVFIALSLFLESKNIDPYWAFIVLMPMVTTIDLRLDMKITIQEIFKISFVILSLLYGLLIWSIYSEEHSLKAVFSIETLQILGYITLFLGGAIGIFGVFPIWILRRKDKLTPRREWQKDDVIDASYFIYRKLPDTIAQKTTIEELERLLATHNPVLAEKQSVEIATDYYLKLLGSESHLTRNDLREIVDLRDYYKRDIPIIIPVGYKSSENL